MKTSNLIVMSAIASSLLAACGGSSNSGNNSSQPQPPVITKYARAIPVAGDNYTYKVTLQSADGSSPKVFYRTDEYSAFDKYGFQRRSINISAPYLDQISESLNQDGAITSNDLNYDLTHRTSGAFPYYSPGGFGCSYTQVATSSASPYYVGQSWDSSVRGTCFVSSKVLVQDDRLRQNKGSIVAQETITVPAGSFITLKEVFAHNYNKFDSNDIKRVLQTSDRTCWRDIKTSAYVKCQITTANPYYENFYTGAGDDQPKLTILEELIGFSVKNGGTLLVPQRFTGNWNISLDDTNKVLDSSISDVRPINIDPDGNISMALGFQPGPNDNAMFQGKIDSAGNLKMTGVNYSGKTTYTLTGVASGSNSISGSIVSSTGASQTWHMDR